MERTTETDKTDTLPTAGQRLRAAREEKGLSLEEVASQTRIPLRHLESLEQADWDKLPAPTYSIGFAKSYASAVGLDRAEIGEQLRSEMGGQRRETAAPEVFQPADPARTMPRWLVLSALGAILLLVVVMSWLSNRSLEAPEATVAPPPPAGASADTAPAQAPQPAEAAGGPVVLTAIGPAWIQVTDQGRTLYEGELAPGQSFPVPQTATAPMLRVGAPEALRITVGGATVPPVGPPGRVTSNVSLRAADLMRSGTQPVPPAPSAPPGVQNTAG